MGRNRENLSYLYPQHASEGFELAKKFGFDFSAEIITGGERTALSAEQLRQASAKQDQIRLGKVREELNNLRNKTSKPLETIRPPDTFGTKTTQGFVPLPENPLTSLLSQYGATDETQATLARRIGNIAGTPMLPFSHIEKVIKNNSDEKSVDWEGAVRRLAQNTNSIYRKMRGAGPK